MFWLILVNAIFAATFTIGNAAMQYISPEFFVGVRMGVAGLFIFGYWYIFGSKQTGSFKKNLLNLLGYSLIGITASYLAEFWTYSNGMPSSRAGLINSFAPFITALISYFFLNEKLNKKKWIALAIGFLGFLPIILQDAKSLTELVSASFVDFIFLISVVAYSLGWIYMKSLVQNGFSPLFINGFSMFLAGIICLAISIFTGTYKTFPSWPMLIKYEGMIIVLGNIICYNMFGFLLKHYSATFVTLSGLILPVFTALYGYIFLGEIITWHFMLSLVILSFSMYLFYKEEIKKEI